VKQDATNARGDELLALVVAGDQSGISNDLCKEFYRGYPIQKLATLLDSDDERALESGAWIASELAENARPILSHLLPLFGYPNTRIKYHSIQTVLTAATDEDGDVVGEAVSLIADDERPVRRMAFELMARADRSSLVAGVPQVKDSKIACLLAWVLDVESESRDDDEIASRLQESDGLGQAFAVVAASRVYARNPYYLQLAASLGESDAQSLAASELAWLTKLEEQAQHRRERAERRNG
jgi:hypothetical protein